MRSPSGPRPCRRRASGLGLGQESGQTGGAQPVVRRPHLPRADLRHLLHRPGDPDRSGAGRRRRQGLGRDLCAGARRDGARSAAARAVLALPDEGGARRLRQFRHHLAPRPAGPAAGLPRDAGAGAAGLVHRRRGRRADGRAGRDPSRPLAGPGDPPAVAVRLFHAGVLAGPGRPAAVLRKARLGRRAGAAGCGVRRHRAVDHRHDHDRQPAGRRIRGVLERASATSCCPLPSWATCRSPTWRA